MNPFSVHFHTFGASSIPELYSTLERVARNKLRLDHLPFLLSDLEDCHPSKAGDIATFIFQLMRLQDGNDADSQVKELTKFLKANPPEVSYENPKLPGGPCTPDQKNIAQFIYAFGIDLPGSKHNLYGHLQYYSSFFIDMFFGNFTEFMMHINGFSSKELKKQLEKREGYCQFSPIFAPILGIVMMNLERHSFLTAAEKERIRLMYSGNNEHKHLQILKKLLKLGANPNAHDIHGFTPLLHAMYYGHEGMIAALLNKGANPNCESIYGFRPLTMFVNIREWSEHNLSTISMLLQYRATLTKEVDMQDIRSSMEKHGDKDLIARVREALPRKKNECEKCTMPAEKKCSACSRVFYCSLTCQKWDWKFHKLSCNLG